MPGRFRKHQQYVVGVSGYPAPGVHVFNNLGIGNFTAIVGYNNTDGCLEDHNVVDGTVAHVTVDANYAVITPGTGTQVVAAGSTGVAAPLYVPNAGSVLDSTGGPVNPLALAIGGIPLSDRTPIGAMHAASL